MESWANDGFGDSSWGVIPSVYPRRSRHRGMVEIGEWRRTKDHELPVLSIPFGEASDMWGSQAGCLKAQIRVIIRYVGKLP